MKFNFIHNEFIRFGMVGALATALHYGIYYALLLAGRAFAGDDTETAYDNVAYTSGYFISLVMNFYLTAYFTFGSCPSWKRAGGFGGAHLVNYLLHMALFNIFLWIGVPKNLAPVPVFAIAIPVNFILVRKVFRHSKH